MIFQRILLDLYPYDLQKNPEWYHSCHKSSVRKQWGCGPKGLGTWDMSFKGGGRTEKEKKKRNFPICESISQRPRRIPMANFVIFLFHCIKHSLSHYFTIVSLRKLQWMKVVPLLFRWGGNALSCHAHDHEFEFKLGRERGKRKRKTDMATEYGSATKGIFSMRP